MKNLLSTAIEFATKQHKGQFRIDGQPYITHPLGVADLMDEMPAKVVAVLHDVLEDTDATEEDIRALGVTDDMMTALRLLTHDWEKATYEEYVAKIKGNSLARTVKLADLRYNMATIDDENYAATVDFGIQKTHPASGNEGSAFGLLFFGVGQSR